MIPQKEFQAEITLYISAFLRATATAVQVNSNQTATVTASAGGITRTSTLNLVAPAHLTSLSCAPSTLGSNASTSCTVTLNQNAAAITSVSLISNNALVTVPASVSVQAGQSSATFSATVRWGKRLNRWKTIPSSSRARRTAFAFR